MKYLKTLVLAAVSIAALVALTGTATATTATYPSGTTYTGSTTLISVNHFIIHGPFGITAECKHHLVGKFISHNPPVFAVEKTAFTECTNGYKVTVLEPGSVSIDSEHVVRSSGETITIHTPLGINCEYTTEETVIGTLTDSSETEGAPELDYEGVIPRTGHSTFCGSSGEVTGTGLMEEPEELFID